ncbi:oligosaccharide flippase family protein [Pedococcus sp. KACC 23699]|uniref:Oligosaccharide flippase family protein n=1 Tax=Pedococcus sp. KACC 23699 TaxID=3149228 RepID=A0AAU7JXG4_9MICO
MVRFLYSVLIGRFLGVAVLGSVNAAISAALLLSLLWPTSAGQAATRFVAQMRGENRSEQAQAVANYLGRRTLSTSLLLALATIAICLLALHSDIWTALCAGLLLLGYAGWSFARGVQYGAGQIVRAAAWDVIGSVFSLVALAIVLLLHLNHALLLPLALSYGVYAIICWPRGTTADVDSALIKPMNRFVGYGVLGTLSSTGLLQLSMIGAHLVGSQTGAGLYAAALSLATPATMLARTLSQVLFPTMAEAGGRGDTDALRRQADSITRGLVVIMMPVFGSLALAGPLVLNVLFGEKYMQAQSLLPVLLIAVMFTTLPVAAVNRLTSTGIGGARFVSAVAAGGLVLAVLLWLLLSPTLGVMGIALGYLIAMACTSAFPIGRAWRLDGQHWRDLWLKVGLGLVLLAAGLGYVHVVSPPLWADAGLALAFVAVWAGIAFKDILLLARLRRGRIRK